MAEPQALNNQADRIAAAKQAQALREQGIKGQAKREGREEREREILAELGAKTLADVGMLPEIRKGHREEMTALMTQMDDMARHRSASGFWRGIGTMGVITVLLCAATGYGVSFFLAESQMNAVAITQAATRPSAEAMRNAMQPQEGGGFQ